MTTKKKEGELDLSIFADLPTFEQVVAIGSWALVLPLALLGAFVNAEIFGPATLAMIFVSSGLLARSIYREGNST
jgi:hypothetical protein